ncbi:MAG: hypothetical protein J0H50_01385 [Xanthomonadales bacterium]|nr:hypothetical protein [Xanthomonadales bacterium]
MPHVLGPFQLTLCRRHGRAMDGTRQPHQGQGQTAAKRLEQSRHRHFLKQPAKQDDLTGFLQAHGDQTLCVRRAVG